MLSYQCPACRTTIDVHEERCRWDHKSIHDIEKCYIDYLCVLSERPKSRFDLLREMPAEIETPLHEAIWDRLMDEGRVEKIGEVDQQGGTWPVYKLLTAAEFMERQEVPNDDALRVIYDHGPVSGCRDNSLYAMICYYESVGFDWERTKELIRDWLDRVDQGGWDGMTIDELLRRKQQVYEQGYHWGGTASEAAKVIREANSGV